MKNILQTLFSVKNSEDKTHKVITIIGIKIKFKKIYRKSYALDSGERQTGKTIEEIRADHVNRYELAVNVIKSHFGSNLNLKGMDVFCGNGYGSLLMEQKTGAELTSIDGSKEAIEFAKKYYGNRKIKYSCRRFPFRMKKNCYDFIVSLESIEHIKDDALFLNRLYGALKQNGILIISTPNMEKQDLRLNPNHFHYRHYYNNEFIKLVREVGFEFVEFYGQDAYVFNENKIMCGMLPYGDMNIKKDYNGQFTVFVLKKRGKLKYSPTSLVIDTTILCNNNCSFCWRSNNKEYLKEKNAQLEQKTMPFNIYKKIIDDACQYPSINWLSLCGAMGEPLLNEDIEKFYEYAYNKKHFNTITINTNGLAIDTKDIGKLLNCINEFSISIDSINPETYEKIHGKDCLDRVIENVKRCVEYKTAHKLDTKIVVRFTENKYNRGEIKKFLVYFKNMGVDYVNYTQEHSFIDVNKNLYNNLTNKYCNQPYKVINFNLLGDLTTCCVNWHFAPTFGSIKERSLKDLWESKIKFQWNKKRLSNICKNCSGLGESQNSKYINLKQYDEKAGVV